MEKYKIEMGTSWHTTNSSTTYTKIFYEKNWRPTRFFTMTSLKKHKAHHHHTNPSTEAFCYIAANAMKIRHVTEVNLGSTERENENGCEATWVGSSQRSSHFSAEHRHL